jgi:hypothetical protein
MQKLVESLNQVVLGISESSSGEVVKSLPSKVPKKRSSNQSSHSFSPVATKKVKRMESASSAANAIPFDEDEVTDGSRGKIGNASGF